MNNKSQHYNRDNAGEKAVGQTNDRKLVNDAPRATDDANIAAPAGLVGKRTNGLKESGLTRDVVKTRTLGLPDTPARKERENDEDK